MPGRPGPDQFMIYPDFIAEQIKGMRAIVLLTVSELGPVVSLDSHRLIAEVDDGSFDKIYRAVAALLDVWIYEALSGSFIDHRVLVELFRHFAYITGSWDVFDIHLPLDAQRLRSVIFLRLPLLLGGRSFS